MTTENETEVPLYGVNIVVKAESDTSRIVTMVTTNHDGTFLFKVDDGMFRVDFSYVGFVTKTLPLYIEKLNRDTLKLDDIILEEDRQLLSEILVEAKRIKLQIDKRGVTFSPEQIQKAKDARNLLLNLPHLLLDRTSNALATADEKNLLILLNGIRANDAELKLIPSDKVKRVEYYDIPPIKYNTSGRVINVITEELDAGWSGDFYLMASEFYTMFTPYVSYINGRNRFTVGYELLHNPKRSLRDVYKGTYRYTLQNEENIYTYQNESQNWGNQQGVSIAYTNYKQDNYIFQVKGRTGFTRSNDNETKEVEYSIGSLQDTTTGLLTNRVKTFSPSADLYYSKSFSRDRELDANLILAFYKNSQTMYSEEGGLFPFKDEMYMSNWKKTVIGELNYSTSIGSNKLLFGYKTNLSSADNSLRNSLTDEKSTIRLKEHYAYGETTGKLSIFTYRASLGAKWDATKTPTSHFGQWTFIPILVLGYEINNKNYLRLSYQTTTAAPQIQQLSDNSIMLLNHIIRKGNADLRNSRNYNFQLNHTFSGKRIDTDVILFYENNRNRIFNLFGKETIEGQDYITLSAANSARDVTYGVETEFTVTPFNGLRLGCNFKTYKHLFTPMEGLSEFEKWFFPVSLYGAYRYKNLSLDYRQILESKFLEGLYVNSIEKMSYLSAGYYYKDLSFQLICYFPFTRNTFKSYTIPESIVDNIYEGRLKSKEKTFGISISWQFNTARKPYRINRKIYNQDSDSGVFESK